MFYLLLFFLTFCTGGGEVGRDEKTEDASADHCEKSCNKCQEKGCKTLGAFFAHKDHVRQNKTGDNGNDRADIYSGIKAVDTIYAAEEKARDSAGNKQQQQIRKIKSDCFFDIAGISEVCKMFEHIISMNPPDGSVKDTNSG